MVVTHEVVKISIKIGRTNLSDDVSNTESEPDSFAVQMAAALADQNSGSDSWKIAAILPDSDKVGSQVKHYHVIFEKTT